MKNLAILSMTFMLLMAFVQLPAQDVKKEAIKSEIKIEKKEIKTERQMLRKLEGTTVNEVSKSAFSKDFGNIPNVRWERGDFFDEATFTKDGKEMKASYDSNSQLVGTIAIKTFADLPLEAQKEIKTKYKEYKIGKVIFFDDNEDNDTDMVIFDTQFDDADYYFVELSNANQKIILQISTDGDLRIFKKI
jgi:hypothetical protein